MNSQIKTIVITSIISAIFAVGITTTLQQFGQPTEQQKNIAAYYANSTATLKSPHSLRKEMNRGYHDFIVVDTRASSDYENGHVTGAVNIDSGQDTDIVVAEFKKLEESSWKPILIYCYSASCMNGRKVGNLLAENGMYVHELTIGYNEWEFDSNAWNYPEELGTYTIDDYITRGTDAGVPKVNLAELSEGCGVEGELSC